MKLFRLIKTVSFLFLICIATIGCEKLTMKYILLDNRSDYTVTVELYTGQEDAQGYNIYKDYSVSAHSTKQVESETSWVTVKGYSPSNNVNMEIDGSKIIFTNI